MRRWAALALLLGATAATLATIAVVVFQLADDGGALVAEAGRPSARRCRLTKLKLQTRLGARHSRLRSPLRREGPGLVLLGAAGGRRAAARAALAYALAQTQIDGADARLPLRCFFEVIYRVEASTAGTPLGHARTPGPRRVGRRPGDRPRTRHRDNSEPRGHWAQTPRQAT